MGGLEVEPSSRGHTTEDGGVIQVRRDPPEHGAVREGRDHDDDHVSVRNDKRRIGADGSQAIRRRGDDSCRAQRIGRHGSLERIGFFF
jgi:hypothetical protein